MRESLILKFSSSVHSVNPPVGHYAGQEACEDLAFEKLPDCTGRATSHRWIFQLLHNKALKTESDSLLFVMLLWLNDAWLGDSASGDFGWDH